MHNMILQYDGLDTIGDNDDDYGEHDEIGLSDDSDDDFDMGEDPHMEGVDANEVDVVPIVIEHEVQVGYAENRSRLWVHYKHACDKGDVRWVKRASVSRPIADRNPYGERGPWRIIDDDDDM